MGFGRVLALALALAPRLLSAFALLRSSRGRFVGRADYFVDLVAQASFQWLDAPLKVDSELHELLDGCGEGFVIFVRRVGGFVGVPRALSLSELENDQEDEVVEVGEEELVLGVEEGDAVRRRGKSFSGGK